MRLFARVIRVVAFAAITIALAACAGQKEPGQQLIADIEVNVTAASAEAAKYVPEQLQEVQKELGELKASFDKQDYATVVATAPAVLVAAASLATAAAAKKDQVLKALNDEWTVLADSVPGYLTAVQKRVDSLTSKSTKKPDPTIDIHGGQTELADATSLWSKAQGAFAAGNMNEAVSTAKAVKAKIEAAAAALKLNLAAA